MAGADLNTPAPNTPVLDLLVEAGDWPAESELRELAQAALAAALAGLGGGADYPPLLRHPRASEARPEDPEQLGTPVKPERDEAGDTDAFPDSSPQGGGEQADAGSELSIVFTDNAAIQRLNAQYRGKDKPTNVLSFPQANGPLLGDIVLAWETVRDEAALAEKPLEAHMAHLVVHGFLHLLGYDHEAEAEAEEMEALERAALRRMGIADPYAAARE